MDFQCLWCTSNSETTLWRALLDNFPYPLTHLHYKNLKEKKMKSLCKTIALCIWSEKEYPKVPQILRDVLSEHKKPSLLLVKNDSFAYTAFEKGFQNCIHACDAEAQLQQEVVALLATYFTPKHKVPFLKNKVYLPVDPKNRILYFLPFDQLNRFYLSKGRLHVELVTNQILSSPAPFLWLWVQCERHGLKFCKIGPNHALNINSIQFLKTENEVEHHCRFTSGKNLRLTSKEYGTLQNCIQELHQVRLETDL